MAHYERRITTSRRDLWDDLQKHGSVLPVLSYDPLQMTSMVKYLVDKLGFEVCYHKARCQAIKVGDKFVFLSLLNYTGSKRADICELLDIPKHEMIFRKNRKEHNKCF